MEYQNKEEIRFLFHKEVFKKLVWGEFLTPRDRELFAEWVKKFSPNIDFFEHYKDKRVLFEIVKYLGHKELCLNENIRWLLVSKIDYLLKVLYFYRVLEYRGKNKKGFDIRGLTFYCGLADFSFREAPPYAIKEKRKWQEEYWADEYKRRMISYDFGLDIDGETFQDAYADAKKVFDFFKKFGVKFSIWCSGRKGWHIICPYSEFKEMVEPFDLDFTIAFCKGLMADIVSFLKLKKVDTTIYSATRYLKCPYSLDSRNGRVIYPLSDEEFRNFNEEMMTTKYLLSQKDLGNRGVFINRNSNPEGFKKMVQDLGENL